MAGHKAGAEAEGPARDRDRLPVLLIWLLALLIVVVCGIAVMVGGIGPLKRESTPVVAMAVETATPEIIEKIVKETVIVEKEKVVEKVVTATPALATSVPPTATVYTPIPPTATATQVPATSTPTVQSVPVKLGLTLSKDKSVTVSTPLTTTQQGGWKVELYEGATDQMKGWIRQLEDLVKDWSKFPNVDFQKYSFKASDGVEYGMDESAYCQRSQTCDVNVPAMHYRLITGDYNIQGIDECSFDKDGAGCGIALFNVGDVTAMYRESMVDYGFTVEGRYWNGDAMPTTIRALMSNTAYNMLNMSGEVNPGANCSSPNGCPRVKLTFVVISGNQLLMKGTTTVTK